jgi:hypothetical protein
MPFMEGTEKLHTANKKKRIWMTGITIAVG